MEPGYVCVQQHDDMFVALGNGEWRWLDGTTNESEPRNKELEREIIGRLPPDRLTVTEWREEYRLPSGWHENGVYWDGHKWLCNGEGERNPSHPTGWAYTRPDVLPDDDRLAALGLMRMDERDVRAIVRALPDWVDDHMWKDRRVCVAGGFARAIIAGETPKDIDMWTPEDVDIVDTYIKPQVGDEWPAYADKNSWTVRKDEPVPVSFVECFRPATLEDCLRRFDFTVCQAGVCVRNDEWYGVVGKQFYADLAARRLVIRKEGMDSPMGTLERVVRYAGRGYRLDGRERLALAVEISKLPVDELEKALEDY